MPTMGNPIGGPDHKSVRMRDAERRTGAMQEIYSRLRDLEQRIEVLERRCGLGAVAPPPISSTPFSKG